MTKKRANDLAISGAIQRFAERAVFALVATWLGCLSACGGGAPAGSDVAGAAADSPTQNFVAVVKPASAKPVAVVAAGALAASAPSQHAQPDRGVLLQGMPGRAATTALLDYTDKAVARIATAQQPQAGHARLFAVVSTEATIGQVNSALSAQRARIVEMAYSNTTITIELPNPGSAQVLSEVAARLLASKAFAEVDVRKMARHTPRPGLPVVEQIDDHQSPG